MKVVLREEDVLGWKAFIEGRPDLTIGFAETADKAVGQLVLLNPEVLGLDIERWERLRVPSPAGGMTPDLSRPPRLVSRR